MPAASRARTVAAAALAVGLALAGLAGPCAAAPAEPEQLRMPGFAGLTLDGKRLSTSSFPGQRLVVFCFNPGIEQAVPYAHALARIAPERAKNNFAIVGVAMGLDPDKAREFAARYRLDFPIFDDSEGDIGARLGLQSPLMLVGTDAEGRVGMANVAFEHDEERSAAAVEVRVREFLRLATPAGVADGKLEHHPKAPAFEAETLFDRGTFRSADLAGRPAVLMFFLPACPHCRDALRFFKEELARLPAKERPAFVGISKDSHAYAVESALEEHGLDFFPALLDRDHEIAEAYGSFAGVPDILFLDAEGRIVARRTGWKEDHDPDVMRMRLARLVGRDAPMLLDARGFSGNDACSACHPKEAATWEFTGHAFAFETLVMRAAERDPKCVGCHVVGFGKAGGYSVDVGQKHLEDVGCESCHGRGGGHLGGAAADAAKGDYRAACAACHDEEHSLGFRYETFLPKISHAAIAALGDTERARLVADRDKPRDLLPKTSDYVGSFACGKCHEREYDVWSRSPHAHAMDDLRKDGRDRDAACVRCHVTGYARPGGFPEDGKAKSHEDLARVGCESCHGPGAGHVEADGKKAAGIVRLGDKCESCVILQICGSCHDDANDPDFRFNVAKKIDAQRHGARADAAAPGASPGR